MSKVRYFTSWYNESSPNRKGELETCVTKCLESRAIDLVYLVCEGGATFPIQHPKLIEIPSITRTTFSDFFMYANSVSDAEDVVIVANTDIFPDESVRERLPLLKDNQAWCLSRWDLLQDNSAVLLDRRDSQDVWIMKARVLSLNAKFALGRPGSDNKIAFELQAAGYDVRNPSKDVKFYHLHLTGVRNYTHQDTVPSPYLLVTPHGLYAEQVTTQILSVTPTPQNPITPHT